MADSGAASGGEPSPLETLSRADVGEAVTAGLSSQPVRTLMQALAEVRAISDLSVDLGFLTRELALG